MEKPIENTETEERTRNSSVFTFEAKTLCCSSSETCLSIYSWVWHAWSLQSTPYFLLPTPGRSKPLRLTLDLSAALVQPVSSIEFSFSFFLFYFQLESLVAVFHTPHFIQHNANVVYVAKRPVALRVERLPSNEPS